jgi:hypothetical protein
MKQTLKLLLTGLILAGSPALLKAQVPQKFNYQGIARDTKGNPMGKQTLGIKLSVLPTSDATTPEYEEVQTITTNEFGLYTLQIGNGTAVTGTMKEVKWETGNKYIKVAIDPQGGTNYADAGTTQLLSVPYAIYADKAGMAKETAGGDRAGAVSTSAAGTGTVNFLTKFTAANTIYNSQVFDNGTNIGIGTTTPAATAKIHINQNSASVLEHMRMQNLSATGAGRFTLYSNGANNYSTFTKYGSGYGGGYAGITTLYPYANLLAFGNNGLASGDGLGRFLISTAGNAGISIFKGGTSKLKFHADFATENVGIGGNSAPVSRVHLNNTDGNAMDLRLTNNGTGHTSSDGLVIEQLASDASIYNYENGDLTFGVNGNGVMSIAQTPNAQPRVYIGPGLSNTNTLELVSSGGFTDTTSIGFANGSEEFVIGMNEEGKMLFGANAVDMASTNVVMTLDDNSQSVGIGITAPTQKLDINGQIRIRGGSPAAGKILTSAADGTASWSETGTSTGGWSINGNAGTTSAHYIGTSDNNPLQIRVNNTSAGYLSSAMTNTFWGVSSGNVALNSGADNTAIGYSSGTVLTGSQNTLVGNQSGSSITSGLRNTCIGEDAGSGISNTSNNTCIGEDAGFSGISGSNNTLIGQNSNLSTASLSYATAIGSGATVNKSNSVILGRSSDFTGIGTNVPGAKLDVQATHSTSNTVPIYGTAVNGATFQMTTTQTSINTTDGVVASCDGASFWVIGLAAIGSGGTNAVGVYGKAQNGTNNYGVYCQGNGGYTGTWSAVSDKKFKLNIRPMTSALDKIMLLKPSLYEMKTKEYPYMGFSDKTQYGFISQELETVLPELVENGAARKDDGEAVEYKGINYIAMVPILTKAIQEQQALIEELQKQIEELKKK